MCYTSFTAQKFSPWCWCTFAHLALYSILGTPFGYWFFFWALRGWTLKEPRQAEGKKGGPERNWNDNFFWLCNPQNWSWMSFDLSNQKARWTRNSYFEFSWYPLLPLLGIVPSYSYSHSPCLRRYCTVLVSKEDLPTLKVHQSRIRKE